MAPPFKVFAVRIRANITAEQQAAMRRERTLTGSSISDIVRRALDAYFEKPEEES